MRLRPQNRLLGGSALARSGKRIYRAVGGTSRLLHPLQQTEVEAPFAVKLKDYSYPAARILPASDTGHCWPA
jgi:hypothetical protein